MIKYQHTANYGYKYIIDMNNRNRNRKIWNIGRKH